MFLGPYNLDFSDELPTIINLSQKDVGGSILINLLSTVLSTDVFYLCGAKPSGDVFVNKAGTWNDGTTVSISIEEYMTDEAGIVSCELVNKGDGMQRGTGNFIINVEAAP